MFQLIFFQSHTKNTTVSNEKTKSFITKRENPEESVKLKQGITINKDQRL